MHKRFIVFIIHATLFGSLAAQLNLLTIEKAVMGGYNELRPSGLYDIQWVPGKNSFSYIENYSSIIIEHVNKKKSREIVELDEINRMLSKKGVPSWDYITNHAWTKGYLVVKSGNSHASIDMDENKVAGYWDLPDSAENVIPFFDKGLIGFTIHNNLYYMKENAKFIPVTHDTIECIVSGQTVSRSEFGISKGIFWSPRGNKMAFYRKNECDVTAYPLVDVTKRPARLENIKYPMAGMHGEHVSVGIYDLATERVVYIENIDTSEQYITSVTWGPGEKYIYAGILNREQNHLKVNKYEASSGDLIKTLFEEKNQKYVEPEHPLYFLNENPDTFIWFSERDGYNHLYMYNSDGTLLKQLTRGNWVVTNYLGYQKGKIFYISTENSPLERHLYTLDVKTGIHKLMIEGSGTFHAYFQKEGSFLISRFENIHTPPVYSVLNTEGKIIRVIVEARNPLAPFDMPKAEIVALNAADDTTLLYGRIIKPHDFDPEKQYPAIVYVYGGPHAQLVTNEWLGGARLWEYYMAQQGYILFTLDNRGSANRGFEFESAIHRNLGMAEGQDQVNGVEYLKSLPYVDTSRLGLHGWSYGGFMTIYLSVHYPGLFKVAVAGGPVIDWKYYEVMYGERYMDTPRENPVGYQKANLLDKCNNLQNHLLIIHGGIDPVVVWQHSLHFVHQCIKNKKQVDYFVYPLHEHNVRGEDRVHLMTKITQYFKNHL